MPTVLAFGSASLAFNHRHDATWQSTVHLPKILNLYAFALEHMSEGA
jgi:hypothetical protein